MDRLHHLDRSLDELDPPAWPPAPADATRLVAKVHALRTVPLGTLRPADLLTLLTQRVAVPYVLPLAVRLLAEEPLLDAYFYPGDLLLAAVGAPPDDWALLPDAAGALRAALDALPPDAPAEACLPAGGLAEVARFRSAGPAG